jgi:sigma-B regulation protein RsbU (phosphoserine phosphatase)
MVAIYSDGITEAISREGEEFGEERLESLLRAYRAEQAEGIIEKIFADVRRHTGDDRQQDDMTMVIVKRQ